MRSFLRVSPTFRANVLRPNVAFSRRAIALQKAAARKRFMRDLAEQAIILTGAAAFGCFSVLVCAAIVYG